MVEDEINIFLIVLLSSFISQEGEINVDQAHRGYSMASDASGYKSVNPLFMKYTPTNGQFSGQLGYGYRSLFASFFDFHLCSHHFVTLLQVVGSICGCCSSLPAWRV